MAQIEIYIPDGLAAQAAAQELDISGLAQDAVRSALEGRLVAWLEGVSDLGPTGVTHSQVVEAVNWAKDETGR